MRRRMACSGTLLLAGVASILLASCGGSAECVGGIPVPSLKSVRPTTIDSLAASTTLTLSGSGFNSSSKVFLNSSQLASTLVDSHHITATVTGEQLFVIGISHGVEIWVTNPGQLGGGILGCANGGSSQPISLTIT